MSWTYQPLLPAAADLQAGGAQENTIATGADGYLQKADAKTTGADGYLQKADSKTTGADGYLQKADSKTTGAKSRLEDDRR